MGPSHEPGSLAPAGRFPVWNGKPGCLSWRWLNHGKCGIFFVLSIKPFIFSAFLKVKLAGFEPWANILQFHYMTLNRSDDWKVAVEWNGSFGLTGVWLPWVSWNGHFHSFTRTFTCFLLKIALRQRKKTEQVPVGSGAWEFFILFSLWKLDLLQFSWD